MEQKNIVNDAGENTSVSIDETLQERGNRYGDFKDHSAISNALRSAVIGHYAQTHPGGKPLEPYMLESIIMICHKLGRIANGDPWYDDNWRDIAGYSQLVVDILQEKQNQQ